MFEALLPEYRIAAIRTGQFVKVEDGFRQLWEGEIRCGPDGVDCVEIAMLPDPPLGDVAARRIEFLDGGALHEPVLWYGGIFQFMEICPEWGCLAVQFGTEGEVAHAWPLRLDALEQAMNDADDLRRSPPPPLSGFFSRPSGISQYPNGDLLVVMMNGSGKRPEYGATAARIDPQGYPVWFRRDYYHHWQHVEEDGGTALVPRLTYSHEPLSVPTRKGDGTVTLECTRSLGTGWDWVDAIDGDGRLLHRIDLTGAMLGSPFAHLLADAFACNPLHLNFIHRIAGDVGGNVRGTSSGDLVVSVRNVNAFLILDAESGRVKRAARGTFRRQHSVHHFEGSRFLLFDNLGAGRHGPSRLMMMDLADGRETTIFPNDATPEALRDLFSRIAGKISISGDRRRALVAFSKAGIGVEVRLSDGAVLKVFRSLHDVSGIEQFPEHGATRPAVFTIMGLDYVHAGDSPW